MTMELYKGRPTRGLNARPGPVISIQPASKRLVLNRAALELLGAEPGDGITLYFDRDRGLLGMRTPLGATEALAAQRLAGDRPGVDNVSIGLAGIALNFEIDLTRCKGQHMLTHDPELGMAVVQLPPGSWRAPALGPNARAEYATVGKNGRPLPETVRKRLDAARSGGVA